MDPETHLAHEPLSLVETRILGCLLEKEATTPDLYPLTLNSLVNACNQKSNRSPVLDLDEEAVTAGLESLRHKKLALLVTQSAARVAKYRHSLDTLYPLPKPQVAILAELLLRGPQTAGELRTRCERLCPFANLETVREELQQLATRPTPLAVELPRQPGKKDPRHSHLLSGTPESETLQSSAAPSNAPLKVEVATALPAEAEARIATLEATVAEQASQLAALQQELATFKSQFD